MVLSQVTKHLSWIFGSWKGFDPLIVSWSVCLCSSIECEVPKTWMTWMVVVGGIYSPNHYSSCYWRWAHRKVRWCTRHGTVHCPVRAMLADCWGLEWLTVEVLCPLAAPDSPVRSDLAVLTSDFCTVHCSLVSAVDRWVHLTVAPLAHRIVWWIIVEWLSENPRATSSRGASAWAPDNVRCATAAPILVFAPNFVEFPNSFSLLVYCWTLCTWDKWQLDKLVSLHGLWWTSNTKINYRKCLRPFPFRSHISHKHHKFLHKHLKSHMLAKTVHKNTKVVTHISLETSIVCHKQVFKEHRRGGKLLWWGEGLGEAWGSFDAAE
jgi:hypothetical protein